MSDPTISIDDWLARFFALRQHRDEPTFCSQLSGLRTFQRQRLYDTHRALLANPATRHGIRFLLDDLYGHRDLRPVAYDIRRAWRKAHNLLPQSVMKTARNALAIAVTMQELDEALVGYLPQQDRPLTNDDYLIAYRALGRFEERRQTFTMVTEFGEQLERYIRSRMIFATFRMVRRPVHAAGLTNLYDFMETCFQVMRPVPSTAVLLREIARTETAIVDRISCGHPMPFEDDNEQATFA